MQGMKQVPRVLNLLNTAMEFETRKGNACDRLFVDISQDVHRKPWSQHAIRAVTTSSEFFNCAEDRMIIPLEHMGHRHLAARRVSMLAQWQSQQQSHADRSKSL